MKRFWRVITGPGFMALLALVGFGLAIYTAFFYEKKPHLVFTSSQPAKVFDIHRSIGGLEISYGGEDLRGGENNLWIMTVVLKNEGNAEVRKGDYDDRDPIGFKLENGQLLEQPSVQSENSYISKNLGLLRDGNNVRFAPVIIEPGESLTLNLLVLGTDAMKPGIVPVGKIAGSSGVDVRSAEDKTKSGVIRDLFYAERWWVQILRSLAYTMIFLIGGLLIAAVPQIFAIPFQARSDKKKKAHRRSQISHYRPGHSLSSVERILTDLYIESGVRPLRDAYRGLTDIASHRKVLEGFGASLDSAQVKLIEDRYFSPSHETSRRVRWLEEKGFSNLRVLSFEELKLCISQVKELCVHLGLSLAELNRKDADDDFFEMMRVVNRDVKITSTTD
ncbi:hypothetical protein [Pseudomonas sp. KCJK8670]|uniref:hypothetical protein n=1 Tax=Pseudomonas sp. KCJK8670 TaxID=3344558 RepID=UPI003905ECE2